MQSARRLGTKLEVNISEVNAHGVLSSDVRAYIGLKRKMRLPWLLLSSEKVSTM